MPHSHYHLLLAFGVFAYAEKRDVQTSGTVTFKVSSLDAVVEVLEGYEVDSLTSAGSHTFKSLRNGGSETGANISQDSGKIEGLGSEYELNDEGNLRYIYEIRITNTGEVDFQYRVSIYKAHDYEMNEYGDYVETDLPTGVTIFAEVVDGSEITSGERAGDVAEGETVIIRVTYTVDPTLTDDVSEVVWPFGALVELELGGLSE